MGQYTISQASRMLSVPRDTLRYYDKLGLLRPARGENGYRCYSEADLLSLQCVELMKYAGLPLADIGTVLHNRAGRSEEGLRSTVEILEGQRDELYRKIRLFGELAQLITQSLEVLGNKRDPADMEPINHMIAALFHGIREEQADGQ